MKGTPGCGVGVMARAPSAPGKTRLAAHVPEMRLRALRSALLADTLDIVSSVAGIDRFIFFTPGNAQPEIAAMAGSSFTITPQRGDDLGDRMRSAFEDLFIVRGYESAVLVGSDIPLLTAEHVSTAQTLLHEHDVVLGPAEDGGYYLIGMRTMNPRLFDGIPWGSPSVFAETVRAVSRLNLTTGLLGGTYDIDTVRDLELLEHDLVDLPSEVAPAVRRWFSGRS